MQLLLILALILASFFILFALQNSEIVTLDLVAFQVESSLALILLVTFSLGIFIGLLMSGYNLVKNSLQISRQNKQIEELQKSLSKQSQLIPDEESKTSN